MYNILLKWRNRHYLMIYNILSLIWWKNGNPRSDLYKKLKYFHNPIKWGYPVCYGFWNRCHCVQLTRERYTQVSRVTNTGDPQSRELRVMIPQGAVYLFVLQFITIKTSLLLFSSNYNFVDTATQCLPFRNVSSGA